MTAKQKELYPQVNFPFKEGDDYWVIEDDGTLSTLSCWDEMSEDMHLENPNRKYFSSEKEGLEYVDSIETYTFAVPCSMLYYIDAQSEKEAREILQRNGGVDLKGEVLIDPSDYLDAYLHTYRGE